MTDQQLDAFIDREIERNETWLEELNERHWEQELEEIKTPKTSVIPESFPIKGYLMWRASCTGLDANRVITSKIRGKKETHSVLEWTYLLDDDVDNLVHRIGNGETILH